MTTVNPYASFLGDGDPLVVIQATPGKVAALADAMGDRAGQSLAPGKWSAREIVCHLADCELVFAFRLRQTLTQPGHVIQPFDQDDWAKSYASYDLAAALAVFRAVRQWNVALVRGVSAEQMALAVRHPERGTMTFATVVETMAGHDLNHLKQLEGLGA